MTIQDLVRVAEQTVRGAGLVYLVAFALMLLLAMYFAGPGLLPHHLCPHCCWCSGRKPWFDRKMDRIRGAEDD